MTGGVDHNRRTILSNAAWNFLGYAVTVAVAFVMCPLLVGRLGDQQYGVWSLVEATVAYFALLDLGIGASVVRYVAKFEAVKDRVQLNRVFNTTFTLFFGIAAVTVAVSIGLALCWPRPLGVPEELATTTRLLLVLLGCNVAMEFIAGMFGSVLFGLGRFPGRVSTEIVLRLAGAAGMVALLDSGHGIVAIALLSLVLTFVKGCLWGVVAFLHLPELRFSFALVDRGTFRSIRGYSLLAFMIMMAGRLSFSSSPIIIGTLLSPESVAYFVIGARLVDYVKFGSGSLTGVLTPAVSSFEARGDVVAIQRLFADATRYVVWLVLPVELGLILLGKDFLSLWLGVRLADLSYNSMVILALPLVLVLSQSISGRILYGIGRLRWLTAILFAEAAVNLALSVLLVRRYGIGGAALGITLPNVVANIAIAYYTCRLIQVSFVRYLRLSFAKPLVAGPLATAVWLAAGWLYPITDWQRFVLVGAAGTLVYAGFALALEFRGQAVVPASNGLGSDG